MYPVTLTYTAILVIFGLYLSLKAGYARVKHKVMLGDGGNVEVLTAMRTHANYVEYTPLALILLALLEANAVGGLYLHIGAGLFTIGRFFHAFGMSTQAPKAGRPIGMVLTFVSMLVGSVAALVILFL